jgi:hypothetical protein
MKTLLTITALILLCAPDASAGSERKTADVITGRVLPAASAFGSTRLIPANSLSDGSPIRVRIGLECVRQTGYGSIQIHVRLRDAAGARPRSIAVAGIFAGARVGDFLNLSIDVTIKNAGPNALWVSQFFAGDTVVPVTVPGIIVGHDAITVDTTEALVVDVYDPAAISAGDSWRLQSFAVDWD